MTKTPIDKLTQDQEDYILKTALESHRSNHHYLDTMTRTELLNLADQLLDELEGKE